MCTRSENVSMISSNAAGRLPVFTRFTLLPSAPSKALSKLPRTRLSSSLLASAPPLTSWRPARPPNLWTIAGSLASAA